MNDVDYLQNNRVESLDFEENAEISLPDVAQLQEADINRPAGKNDCSCNAEKPAHDWLLLGNNDQLLTV